MVPLTCSISRTQAPCFSREHRSVVFENCINLMPSYTHEVLNMRGALQRQPRAACLARTVFSQKCVQAPVRCRTSFKPCNAVCPPPPKLAATQGQDTCVQNLNDAPHKALFQEQKDLVESIRDKSKRIRKLAKKVGPCRTLRSDSKPKLGQTFCGRINM